MGQSLQMITELRERLDVFLGKLRQRGEEIAAEARATAPEIKANDTDEYKRSFLAFQTGIGNQMHQLVEKAEQVFHKQFSVYMSVEDHDVRAVFLEAEDAVEDFSDYIDTLTESIFMESETDDAEKQYNQAVADWKEAAARLPVRNAVPDSGHATVLPGTIPHLHRMRNANNIHAVNGNAERTTSGGGTRGTSYSSYRGRKLPHCHFPRWLGWSSYHAAHQL